MFSNLRLLDCINRPEDLIARTKELGLTGLAITDHECLSAAVRVNKIAKQMQATDPDFTIALGNEIYLTETREPNQQYYHFILIAKDKLGFKALKELSSIAWSNVYSDRRMERVPTLKSELFEVMSRYQGHVIATSACIGGELGKSILNLEACEAVNDAEHAKRYHEQIVSFMQFCIQVFGSDFYIECAPSNKEDQIAVNKRLKRIAEAFGVKMTVGTDAHYLNKEDRYIHKAYLNSKGGEREVDDFYEFARLMDPEETRELLKYSFTDEWIDTMFENSQEIKNKIEFYDISHKQQIPKIKVLNYPKSLSHFGVNNDFADELDGAWKTIKYLLTSDNVQERYWINQCLDGLIEKGLWDWDYINRIEIEAAVIKKIGEDLDDCLYAYFNTFQHYIDIFWECGSIVGPGRGSATGFLSNYLLGITQLDSIRWELPYWRFLNEERSELPDIDIDLAPSKRPAIFEAIREERGGEFGLAQVATFGTEGTKSAILTACRGYRSAEYPEGIDVDDGLYMSSLIPSERGFLWSINDVVNGNIDKDRKPVTAFIKEVNKYPGLLQIIMAIEGLVNKRSCHASGVILYDEDPYETAAFMRTPSGDLITCFDLHDAEYCGDTKYDFLVTEISDKIIKCYELLDDDGLIEEESLYEFYQKQLHPEVIDTSDVRIWQHLAAGDVMDVFQFSTGVGLAIAKKLRPQNPSEMTAANAMMRLMSEKDKESQQDRFFRIKNQGIDVFEQEMQKVGLPDDIIDLMHKYCDKYYGCCPIQEQMMEILMDIMHFSLAEANDARKIVAKKQMSRIPELKVKVYESIENKNWADYLWENTIAPQLGYAFSLNHSLPYSFVGIQSILLTIKYNPIYWNTACLIVNSGAVDPEKGGQTDYGKIAKAIGDVKSAGIEVSLVDINSSKFGFAPDVKNNKILYGMKGLLNVGDDNIAQIIENRPYVSIKDFYQRVHPEKTTMISLIKAGAFDELEDRKFAMAWYIWTTCDKKKNLTLQNMASLIRYNMLPESEEKYITARQVYEFNRYLKAICKYDSTNYRLNERAVKFILDKGWEQFLSVENDDVFLNIKNWDKIYQSWMDVFRGWIAANKAEILDKLNAKIFMDDWIKYATGSYSSWEMETMCFYYHPHELLNVNNSKYGLMNFYSLPENPAVDRTFVKGNAVINLYKLTKICGTCIAKNKDKGLVTLLTVDGVVTVRFRKEYFALFDKQISAKGADGKKHVVEKSWFKRGSMIVVQGMRRGDEFVAKKYASSGGHQLYKIQEVLSNGDLILQTERNKGEIEEDD